MLTKPLSRMCVALGRGWGMDGGRAVLGAERGIGEHKVSLEEQVFASQALVYKCRRRQAPITGDDVECLLRLALAFTGRGLRPVLTQASCRQVMRGWRCVCVCVGLCMNIFGTGILRCCVSCLGKILLRSVESISPSAHGYSS